VIEAAAPRWTVPRAWVGETCAVIAPGPSLTVAQCERLRGRCRAIAVSNAGIDTLDSDSKALIPARAPWADVLFSADAKWWREYRGRAMTFAGLKVSLQNGLTLDDVHQLSLSGRGPYDARPTHLAAGGNSGYGAVHVAAHFGATRILLVGFDMRTDGKRRHYFGSHPPALNSMGRFATWIKQMLALQRALAGKGVTLVQCTPGSALRLTHTSTVEAEFPDPPMVEDACRLPVDLSQIDPTYGGPTAAECAARFQP
jgi:hypothetical protein